mgnify:CR=1 FL=1
MEVIYEDYVIFPGRRDAILECDWVIDEPERFKGKWESVLGKEAAFLRLEWGKPLFDGYGAAASGEKFYRY